MVKKLMLAVGITALVLNSFGQSTGELKVSVATSGTGGEYAPRNIMAVWVEDSSGNFVKTLIAYADKRKNYLTNWKNSTTKAGIQYNVVDAITSATKNSHDTRTCTWNGTDYSKKAVADGSYKLCMELTDKNGTGNYSSFVIAKGSKLDSVSPANAKSFSNINLVWTPAIKASNTEIASVSDFVLFPNPTKEWSQVKGSGVKMVSILSSDGRLLFNNNSAFINLSAYPKGIYLVKVKGENKEKILKLIKE